MTAVAFRCHGGLFSLRPPERILFCSVFFCFVYALFLRQIGFCMRQILFCLRQIPVCMRQIFCFASSGASPQASVLVQVYNKPFLTANDCTQKFPIWGKGESVSGSISFSFSYSVSVVTLFVTGDVTAPSQCDAGCVTFSAARRNPPLGVRGESVSVSNSVSFSYSISGVTHETVCNVS